MDLSQLKAEFPPEDLEWRVQRSGMKDGKPWAIVVPYITNRAIMERLDEVCSIDGWSNEFLSLPNGGFLCGITIEGVTKWDGADTTEIEAVKGGLSNAMKRAAVQWGIGRYLYSFPSPLWAEFHEGGKYRDRIKSSREDTYGTPFNWDPPDVKNGKSKSRTDYGQMIKAIKGSETLEALQTLFAAQWKALHDDEEGRKTIKEAYDKRKAEIGAEEGSDEPLENDGGSLF